MAGRAPIAVADFGPLDNVFLFDAADNFVSARNPLNLHSNIRKDISLQRLGPGYSFAKAITKAYPSDTLLLVVNARGGTPIEEFMKGNETGYYDGTIARVRRALLKKPSASLEAVIWHQGESNRETYKDYLVNLRALVEDYRKDLNAPGLPFIVGQLGQWNSTYSSIRNEIAQVEVTIAETHLVASKELTNFDTHHFDNSSQKRLGLRFARKYLEISGVHTTEVLSATGLSSFQAIRESLHYPIDDYVLVAAHRGDWRNAPENSLLAIQLAMEMGVDIVEVDVQLTADSVLVLMHDNTLDRTTTCTGRVSEILYDELCDCSLRDGLQDPTLHKVPTLKQALQLGKDRVIMNLDKAEDHIPLVFPLLKETQTINQSVFSSYYTYEALSLAAGPYLDSILYMPKVKHSTLKPENYLDEFISNTESLILQTRSISENDTLLSIIPYAKQRDILVWLNSLEDFHCAGHTDEKALLDSTHWDWFLTQGANIIQTDRPRELLGYLREKGLHP